jgi:hypothetical protein
VAVRTDLHQLAIANNIDTWPVGTILRETPGAEFYGTATRAAHECLRGKSTFRGSFNRAEQQWSVLVFLPKKGEPINGCGSKIDASGKT